MKNILKEIPKRIETQDIAKQSLTEPSTITRLVLTGRQEKCRINKKKKHE